MKIKYLVSLYLDSWTRWVLKNRPQQEDNGEQNWPKLKFRTRQYGRIGTESVEQELAAAS